MTCDDGIVKICDVVNASEPGMKPKIQIESPVGTVLWI